MGRLFGTDGVRGVANADLTPELTFAVGRAGASVIARSAPADRPIVVGRDTRISGTMLEAAIVAGITSAGRDVVTVGVVPTPAVACITRAIEAAAGVMISASHNPIEDNGIKFFGPDGFKLSNAVEDEIEASLGASDLPRPTHDGVGRARAQHGLIDRYLASLLEAGSDLRGLTIVVDAAFGAAYHVGPAALARLGADVVGLHTQDDGRRINVDCGATDLRALRAKVQEVAAQQPRAHVLGVAFDGDADRALFVDEAGQPVSGDHAMLILARERKADGQLAGDTVVGTVMSNIGLERALQAEGITLLRAAVGDRYVLEMMRTGAYALGGEQSGHIIDLHRNTTGDGPMTAVALFSIVARQKKTLRELGAAMRTYPQILLNVRTTNKEVLEADAGVREAIARAQETLADRGRVL
ncbi:MAG TPA: phosphoglucosamine mutase, partial [Candidatus Acidoferrales bacterium]|nr:phosphoglucosamine mutase [Candidatus Acidoferrales bacterium]